jgi:2-phosphoglycerate kinase
VSPLPLRSENQGGTRDPALLREQLRHVYWIGGGSCAGKSSVAQRLAHQYKFHLYATDEVMTEHTRRSKPEECPFLHTFMAMDIDDRWLNRSPAAMLETFHWFQGEAFEMIIDDLLCMPTDIRVIVEGFRVLPRLVQPILEASNQAVWLLPSPEFREAIVERRSVRTSGFLAKTSNPERALENLLARDGMFTDRLRNEVKDLELCSIEVNAATSESDTAKLVEKIFGL